MRTKNKIDPVTFEILRHRVGAINDEGASSLMLVSGSPVASEVLDFNTALLNAKGEVIVIGPYILEHGISLEQIVKYIIANYQDNPGINEGDMFLCNDPYVGALHQNDVALVAPIYWEGELVGWTGVAVHQQDVGGPGKGQVSIGATSIFEEAPVFPPIKLIERGIIRKDLEGEYFKRSRLPERLGLDLRAMTASNNVTSRRIRELIKDRGIETVKSTFDAIIDYVEVKLRSRLMELPDGTWRHTAYLDYGDKIYPCKLTMTKKKDKLVFDFTGTAAQAPAVINCTYPVLQAIVTGVFMMYLGYGIFPPSSGAAGRCLEVVSEPGTFVHAIWPAGVSKATTGARYSVIDAGSVCLAKMLAASDKYRDRVMAPWRSSSIIADLFGIDQRGAYFGASILDFMAGGAGARSYKDGIDTGGQLGAPAIAIANVETHEFRYPMLFLYRKQERDTGGPGKFRGGVALGYMWMPHDVEEISNAVIHAIGLQSPNGVGIYGGYPSSTHVVSLKRNTNILDIFRDGKLPASLDEIDGKFEIPPQLVETSLKKNDIIVGLGQGGGGYGDPIERDARLVANDVTNELVSRECARDIYGVVLDPQTLQPDIKQTEERRLEIKRERAGWQK
ncbi:MAG: hydantoinase B/oxoprolinase family protein [Chloroflexi bacterium]|nr:hydantoinase B/oxoprolinase family protein [Chloroflexota bacterium]